MFHLRNDHNQCTATAIRHNMLFISAVQPQLRLLRKRTHNQNAKQTSHLFDLLYHTWCFMGLLHMCIHRLQDFANARIYSTGNASRWSWPPCDVCLDRIVVILYYPCPCRAVQSIWVVHTLKYDIRLSSTELNSILAQDRISHIGVYLYLFRIRDNSINNSFHVPCHKTILSH